ncbi:MAG: OsmC family protein [Chitinophagales bacterium]|nr:OsmC family protein [Chitinophagales bacterium]
MTCEVTYKGELRCEMTHLQSGDKIITDAPTDNHGRGKAFSPTDLTSSSTAVCALTTIGIAAEMHGFNIEGSKAEVTKVMSNNPRRISEVHITFYFPFFNYSQKEKKLIEHAARTCPVMLSLHPDIKKEMTFIF